MKKWRKSDIGKVIVYRRENGLNNKIIIYNVDLRVPNTVGFVQYPLSLSSTIYPPFVSSKIGIIGVVKSQKKENESYLEKAGDWCYIERVSRDQRKILETIVETPKKSLDII